MKRVVIRLLLALCIAHVQGSIISRRDNQTMDFILESKCLEKENLTMDEVMTFSLDDQLELAESKPQLKCFTNCIYEYAGIMVNCNIKEEHFADDEMLADVHRALVTCKGAEEAGESCECAFQLWKCMLEQEISEEADN